MTAVTRSHEFSRRSFLSVAGLSAISLVGAGALSACGKKTELVAGKAGDATLPKFVAFTGSKPDLAGSAEGLPAGFYAYPKPFKSVSKSPLSGQTITAITNIFGPPPNGRDKNPAWQEIEKRLGGKVDIQAVSSDDFDTKFNTVVAGNNLPDLMLNNGSSIPNIVEFLEAKCADLTPYLAGDKVSEYPNLAAIPKIYWEQTVQAGKIYSLPIPRGLTGGSGFYNSTLFEAAGVTDTSQIKNADDFYAVLKKLTNPSKNQWALGSTKFGLTTFHHIFGTPNTWRESSGKLTRSFETDEYMAAIEFAAKLYKDGMFVPGSEGWTKSQMVNAFIAGKVALIYDGLPGYLGPTGYGKSLPAANKSYKAKPFIPFGHDGGKAQTWLDNIVFSTVMVKKNDDARIKQILGVANFLASPFGSEEYLLLNYGAEGKDYQLDDKGNPIATPDALLDTAVPWKFLAAPQQVVYDPTTKETVDIMHDTYSKLIPLGVANPCSNLFSPTDAQKGASLAQPISDAVTAAIAGRGTMEQVKKAVSDWKTKGGDKIRGEYEQALAK